MADSYLRGSDRVRSYRTTLNVDVSDDRLAAAIGVPIIHLKQNDSSFRKKISEAQTENLAALLGQTVGDTRTNAGLDTAP